MTRTIEQELIKKMGPDIFYQGNGVFVESVKIGEFEKPWETVCALHVALKKYAARKISERAA